MQNLSQMRARFSTGRSVVFGGEWLVAGALTRSALKRIVYRYGPVISGVAVALGVSFLLPGYVYPRPLVLLALVLSIWGRGLGPGLFGAGLATVTVGLAFPELVPRYGMVSDAPMFLLPALTFIPLIGANAHPH